MAGFVDPLNYCCKDCAESYLPYWKRQIGYETAMVFDATSCDNPSEYISWDGVHYTEAANDWVASRIFNGTFSDPLLSIAESCM